MRSRDRLQCLRVTRDTHCTTAAALYAEDNRFVGQETTVLAVEIAEALLQAFADMFGQPLVHAAGTHARQVATCRQSAALAPFHKVAQALGRRNRRSRTVLESKAFELLLEAQTSKQVCLWVLDALRANGESWANRLGEKTLNKKSMGNLFID